MDTVRVSPDNFKNLMFMEAVARREFTVERIPNAQKPQKMTKAGVPVWSVKVAGIDWKGQSVTLPVSVASADNPADHFTFGEPVQLDGLVFGVTAKRDGNGYTVWCSADGVTSTKTGAAV